MSGEEFSLKKCVAGLLRPLPDFSLALESDPCGDARHGFHDFRAPRPRAPACARACARDDPCPRAWDPSHPLAPAAHARPFRVAPGAIFPGERPAPRRRERHPTSPIFPEAWPAWALAAAFAAAGGKKGVRRKDERRQDERHPATDGAPAKRRKRPPLAHLPRDASLSLPWTHRLQAVQADAVFGPDLRAVRAGRTVRKEGAQGRRTFSRTPGRGPAACSSHGP